jgi:ankyrin repeat protein
MIKYPTFLTTLCLSNNRLLLCLSREVQVELIQAFIDYDPIIVRIPHYRTLVALLDEGQLPLHLACTKVASGDVIRALIKAYPSSLKNRCIDGNLPLHYACRDKSSVEVIQVLIELFPNSICTSNYRGRLPIHLACYNLYKTTVDKITVVDTLIQLYPDSEYDKDYEGDIPTVCACNCNNESLDCLIYFAQLYPDTLVFFLRR